MRFWFSVPFIRHTRIGISVSDREIARAFRRQEIDDRIDAQLGPKSPSMKKRELERQRCAEEDAKREEHVRAIAKRWTPFISWVIIIAFWVAIISMIICGWYLTLSVVCMFFWGRYAVSKGPFRKRPDAEHAKKS